MIGVCIRFFHENYGGMLQAYATVSLLESLGLDYELIRYEKRYTPIGVLKSLPRLFNRVLINDKYEAFLKKKGKKKHPDFANNDAIRMEAFHDFKDTHFTHLSPVFLGYEELCKGARRYSAVVTGSDQLWSPAGLPTNFYNLQFVPDDIRKISYASSFGVKTIPWYQKKRTAAFLNRLDYISMREERGSEIVKELTGKEVPTILDPVFMFDSYGWERLIPYNKVIEGKYLFAYFLGETPEYRTYVTRAAEELGCEIVALRHLDRYVPGDETFGDVALYDVGPDLFLNLLRGASYVCTDSYHGACFSIIHEIPFIVFNRYSETSALSKNSRIDTLCENLHLQGRRFNSDKELTDQLVADIDWIHVKNGVDRLRGEAEEYINHAFDGVQ